MARDYQPAREGNRLLGSIFAQAMRSPDVFAAMFSIVEASSSMGAPRRALAGRLLAALRAWPCASTCAPSGKETRTLAKTVAN